MKRLALMLLLVAALATSVGLLLRPATQASPDVAITVNSTADTNTRDSVMTLREAMLMATGDLAVADLSFEECQQVSSAEWSLLYCWSPVFPIGSGTAETIVFDTSVFPPVSPATITLGSALPTLNTGGDTVDGTSTGVIVGYTPQILSPCFDITSDNNTIKGLEINGCYGGAVGIRGGAEGNTVGGSSPGEGNVMSHGGEGDVVEISGSGTDANVVKGNYIHSNHGNGVVIGSGARDNTVGGSNPGDRNVISGQTISGGGVAIAGSGTRGNVVKGNYIGTDPSGTSPLSNGQWGVFITSGAQDNTIGGSSPGDRNVISGNLQEGVFISGSGTTGNVVRGNYIGTNASGTAGLPNGAQGVAIGVGAQDNTIGGTGAGEGNLIAYNEDDGVWVYSDATATDAAGNTSEFSTPMAVPEPTLTPSPTPSPTASPTATGTPSPTATPTPPAGPTRTLQWAPGWHNAAWSGASTPAEVFACAAGKYAAAYRLVNGSWERYFPDRPDISNMGPLAPYDAFLILITQPVTCTMPVAVASGSSRTLQWGVGWQNAGWSGADGTPPEQAFACAAGNYAAAYRFTDAGLERYFPGRPDISNMGPLNKYDAFLILVTAPVSCTMAIAP